MYLCSAKCCETDHYSMDDVQNCIDRCNSPVTQAQSFMQNELSSFQVSELLLPANEVGGRWCFQSCLFVSHSVSLLTKVGEGESSRVTTPHNDMFKLVYLGPLNTHRHMGSPSPGHAQTCSFGIPPTPPTWGSLLPWTYSNLFTWESGWLKGFLVLRTDALAEPLFNGQPVCKNSFAAKGYLLSKRIVNTTGPNH